LVSEDLITPDLQYGDLIEWDSLGHMNIMMSLEDSYGVEISTETITELVSIEAILEYINQHATQQN
jgi:citrate synthase